MKRCDRLIDIGRRQFLSGSAAAAAAVGAATPARAQQSGTGLARVEYPSTRLANLSDLVVNEPFDVAYPDEDAPGVLLKLGAPVEGGAGPDRDVVGYTILCPHKGYYLFYSGDRRVMQCPGHYSIFDVEKRRAAGLGARDAEPAAVPPPRGRGGRHPRRGRGRASLRPPVQRPGLREGAMTTYKRHTDRLPIIPADATRAETSSAITASSAAATTPTRGPPTARAARRRRTTPSGWTSRSSSRPRPRPGTRRRCTTSSRSTARIATW